MGLITPEHITWVERITGHCVEYTSFIQSLWNDYGACFRAKLANNDAPVVVKYVVPNPDAKHPRGWQSNHGHNRKVRSFQVEQYFYANLQPQTNITCQVPRNLYSDTNGDASLLVLEDLDHLGFTARRNTLSINEADVVLKWLANFHALFINSKDSSIWPQGGYWHLATRQAELQAMEDGPLKKNAQAISERLHNSTYSTILHGDAKVANFCFTQCMTQCAAVDFQYVGHGPGIIDVAYFLGSALSEEDLCTYTDDCLNSYFVYLYQALSATLKQNEKEELISQWRELYVFACADFHRFLAGWSPEHWKINELIAKQTQQALNKLAR